MIKEVRTFQITCDKCGKKEVVYGEVLCGTKLPEDWGQVLKHTHVSHYCNVCIIKRK